METVAIQTYAQEKIMQIIKEKMNSLFSCDLPWGDYDDYNDYNDCHGDYYDVDYQ